MDITTIPDMYTPSVNNEGNYIDNIPIMKNRIFCPCGTRKDKPYESASKFACHIKTKSHQKWLMLLNQNKANYYVELIKTKDLVESQQQIIAQLENQLQKKSLTIDYLTEQLTKKMNQPENIIDLIDFN